MVDIFTVILWVVTVLFFILSLVKDSKKTFASTKMARNMMKNMIGEIIGILFLIGLILTFIPPQTIKSFMGSSNVVLTTIFSALIGTITLIPAFVAFPLAGSLVNSGASIVPVVAFLTTLTMVGFVTYPLEKREFGARFAISRNLLSFIAAIIIALVMGVLA